MFPFDDVIICNRINRDATFISRRGRVMYLGVSKLGRHQLSNSGFSSVGRQAIIYTNDGLLLIGPRGQNFKEQFNLWYFANHRVAIWSIMSVINVLTKALSNWCQTIVMQ